MPKAKQTSAGPLNRAVLTTTPPAPIRTPEGPSATVPPPGDAPPPIRTPEGPSTTVPPPADAPKPTPDEAVEAVIEKGAPIYTAAGEIDPSLTRNRNDWTQK